MVVDYKQFEPGPGAGLRITLVYVYIYIILTVDSGKPNASQFWRVAQAGSHTERMLLAIGPMQSEWRVPCFSPSAAFKEQMSRLTDP